MYFVFAIIIYRNRIPEKPDDDNTHFYFFCVFHTMVLQKRDIIFHSMFLGEGQVTSIFKIGWL